MSDLKRRWIATSLIDFAKREGTCPAKILACNILRESFMESLGRQTLVTEADLEASVGLARVIASRRHVAFGTPEEDGAKALRSLHPANWEAGVGRKRVDDFIE